MLWAECTRIPLGLYMYIMFFYNRIVYCFPIIEKLEINLYTGILYNRKVKPLSYYIKSPKKGMSYFVGCFFFINSVYEKIQNNNV